MGRGGMTSVLSHSLHLECQRLLSVLSHWRKLLICTDSCILLRFHVIVFSLKTIFHSFFWRYLTWTWSHSVAVFNQYRLFLCPLCQSPPNFLHAASLAKHVKPVVVIPDEEEPEQQDDDDDDPEPLIEVSDVSTSSVQAQPQVRHTCTLHRSFTM